jgi:two-component system, chemotaxis family, protein-glutamate methylesterase/glutaminase
MTKKLLIVDDSALNRSVIARIFEGRADITVVGFARDGEEALRLFSELLPDIVTLDLEMPKMDGFTCLRFMLAKRRVPVIVVSSYVRGDNVVRALELGAFDFVTKDTAVIEGDAARLRREVEEKVLCAASVDLATMQGVTSSSKLRASIAPLGDGKPRPSGMFSLAPKAPEPEVAREPAARLVAILASTGGPGVLFEMAKELPADAAAETATAIVVAQHMPEKFTYPFAARLDQAGPFRAKEVSRDETELLLGRSIYVCPGGKSVEVSSNEAGAIQARSVGGERDVARPSGDRLFRSVASVMGAQTIGIVLTGMGADGVLGARAIRMAGGQVWVQSPETAVARVLPELIIREGLATAVFSPKELWARMLDVR